MSHPGYTGPLDGKLGIATEKALADFFSVLRAVDVSYSVAAPDDFVNALNADVGSE